MPKQQPEEVMTLKRLSPPEPKKALCMKNCPTKQVGFIATHVATTVKSRRAGGVSVV